MCFWFVAIYTHVHNCFVLCFFVFVFFFFTLHISFTRGSTHENYISQIQIAKKGYCVVTLIYNTACISLFCKCQGDAACIGVKSAALLCSVAWLINHETGHILVLPLLSLLGLIKQFSELESQIPLLQIIINYGESAQRCWTQLYSAQPWHSVIHCFACFADVLSFLIRSFHFCKLGSASQQTKKYVLLFH